MENKNFNFKGLKLNGFLMLFVLLAVMPAVIALLFISEAVFCYVIAGVLLVCTLISLGGFMELEPNEARVMVFFGKYQGTFIDAGVFWVNPFQDKKKLSLRARNLDVAPIKVNDKIGNPILIGLVLVWKLSDCYKAMGRPMDNFNGL